MFRAAAGCRSHMLTRLRKPPSTYALELRNWQKSTKDQLNAHRTAFWQSQTEVEHQWMDSYTRKTEKKLHRQLVKSKENTVLYCQKTKEKLDFVEKKRNRQAAKAEARRKHEEQLKSSRERLITALNIDSSTWITPFNIDEKLKEGLIVPLSLDYTDYYQDLKHDILVGKEGLKLNGDLDYNNRAETVMRNTLMLPLFTDLKGIIRKMTFSELVKLDQDFEAAKSVLKLEEKPDLSSKLTSLREKYLTLASALDSRDQQPHLYIQKAYEQMVYSQELLYKWNEYIHLARLSDDELKGYLLGGVEKQGEQTVLGGETLQEAGEKEETWEQDFEAPNPEDSDESPLESVSAKVAAIEKDRLLQELADFDVEKTLSAPSPSARTAFVSDFDMYTGADQSQQSAIYAKEHQEDIQTLLTFMFGSIASRLAEPGDVFDSFGMVSEPKPLLQAPEERVFNTSLVLGKVRKALASIKEEKLSFELRVKKSEVMVGLETLENIRVSEPRLLHRIFQHHRYLPPKFRLD